MPRQARLDAPGTLHHVMIRGIEGVNIFGDDKDREQFLSRMEEIGKATGTRILAWVLMDNHVHVLLISGPPGLPRFMRRLLTGYAMWFNRRHRRWGHLFQNRYKSIVCVLVGKVRGDWQERQYVLNQFGRGERQSIRAYRKFMEEGKGIGRRPELVGGGLIRSLGGCSKVLSLRSRGEEVAYDSRILGNGDFVQEVMRDAGETIAQQVWNRKTKSIEEIIGRMCREPGVSEKEIKSGSQRRGVSKVRADIAHFLSRELGISMAEIARKLGVGASAIAMAMKRKDSRERQKLR